MAAYRLTDNGKEHWAVQITDGPFSGVVVSYAEISFGDETSDGTMPMHFHYDIIDDAGYGKYKLQASNDFVNELGDTLTALIQDSVLHQKAKQDLGVD